MGRSTQHSATARTCASSRTSPRIQQRRLHHLQGIVHSGQQVDNSSAEARSGHHYASTVSIGHRNRSITLKGWSCAACPLQRFLYSTLGCVPTTAGSAQFCLLCCQPEPVPESLPARPPSLTRRCPCSLPVWSGQPIHMVHRTYSSPRHSVSQTPLRGTERCDPPQIQILDC